MTIGNNDKDLMNWMAREKEAFWMIDGR